MTSGRGYTVHSRAVHKRHQAAPVVWDRARMPDKRFLQIAEVAEILDVSVRQVRALLERGDLIGIQIGGRGQWRIEVSELEAYIARCYDAARAARPAGATPR